MDEERVPGTMHDIAEEVRTTVQQGIEQGKARLPDLQATIDTVKSIADQARSGAMRAGTALQETARQAGDQVNDAAAGVYRQGVEAGDYLRRRTADQPLTALLIAGAIGYLLAVMLRRRW